MKINEALKKQNLRMLSAFWVGLIFLFLVFQYALFHLEKTFHQKALEVWLGENKSKLSELVFVENTLALKNIIATPPVFSESLNKVSIFDLTGNALVNQNNFANSFLNIKKQNSFGFNTTIFPPKVIYFSDLIFAGKNQGYLYLESFLSEKTLFINTVILILMFLGFYLYYRFLQKRFNDLLNQEIIDPVLYLSNQMNQGESVDNKFILNKPVEFVDLYLNYNNMLSRLKTLSEQNEIRIREAASLDMAKQVSHDIRSPLSALNMVVPSLDQIPENKRVLIRNAIGRINDIANSLLEKGKQSLENPIQNLDSLELSQSTESILVSSLIDSLVSEKRIQYRDNSKMNIEANLQESYGLFIQAYPADLKRVISNLINNSVEAFDNNSGNVEVIVNANENNVVISIVDNGKGIPKAILERLGEKGITYGKTTPNSGSGLGIYHAKKTVESFYGKFQVESAEGNGTTIQLIIPKTKCPDWFVPELNLEPNQKIIICDDDSSIHGLWSGRFTSKSKYLHEIHFSSAADIISWVQKEKLQDPCLFLMDYELLNSPKTGLDLIEELGIAAKSILVTSRFEESWIQNRCKKLGVRLIPKGLASLVPIKIQNVKIKYDAVLIDDDLIIHMTWNLMAKEKNKKIICFTDENLFLNACDEIHFDSSLYIDMNLKDGKSGIQVAENLYKKGFKNISLATGYDKNSIEKPPYTKSILGKDFPF